MKNNIGYKGIDRFRLIAAILVITIHTSPLEAVDPTADFILTRVVARIAVPFFFMVSGFFLLSDKCRDLERLKKYLKKTILIYLVSILLYLPPCLYNGCFSENNSVLKILKDIFFDGTFYHLWYLPASAVGGVLSFFAVRKIGYKNALAVFSLLYIIGLLGDSYYGVFMGFPTFKAVYNCIFSVSDYTRNGIFFAPIFMLLGGFIKEKEISGESDDIKYKESGGKEKYGVQLICAASSFFLMLAEALVLHKLGVQRHDCMYVFLVPLMWFLLNCIVKFKGKHKKYISELALIVYIIHPITIIAVRGEAKAAGLESMFIDNGILHFIAVCVCSFAEGIGLLFVREILRKPRGKHLY